MNTIMRFHVSQDTMMFFAGITMIFVLVKIESATDVINSSPPNSLIATGHPSTFSNPRASSDNSFISPSAKPQAKSSNKKNAPNSWYPEAAQKLGESRKDTDRISHLIFVFLSPSTLSNPDLFQYFIRETSKLPSSELRKLNFDLGDRLRTDGIPESVMPYAQALHSICRAQAGLIYAKEYIKEIQNDPEHLQVPAEISSPPEFSAFRLFSSEIFSDPNLPTRLLNVLIQIPNNDIFNLSHQLDKYANRRESNSHLILRYRWYANCLRGILLNTPILENLKRNMAEIQRLSTASHPGFIDVPSNSDSKASTTSSA